MAKGVGKVFSQDTWKVTAWGILGLIGFRFFWELVGGYIEDLTQNQLALGIIVIFVLMLVVADKNIFNK